MRFVEIRKWTAVGGNRSLLSPLASRPQSPARSENHFLTSLPSSSITLPTARTISEYQPGGRFTAVAITVARFDPPGIPDPALPTGWSARTGFQPSATTSSPSLRRIHSRSRSSFERS